MSNSNTKYNAEVVSWLKGLQPGWKVIDEICRKDNRSIFITAVKAYIDEDRGDVYFDSTYKRLRKIEILNLKPQKA